MVRHAALHAILTGEPDPVSQVQAAVASAALDHRQALLCPSTREFHREVEARKRRVRLEFEAIKAARQAMEVNHG